MGEERGRENVVKETQGTRLARERRLQGSWPASGARSPPSVPKSPGSLASNGNRGRWRGVTSASPPSLWQARRRVPAGRSARFVLVTARPACGQRLPPHLGIGTSEPARPAGAQGRGRAAAGSGMRPASTFAGPGRLPGSQMSSPSRTLALRLDSLSPIPEGLETPPL